MSGSKECPPPPVLPLHPWTWPTQPWRRIHIDFAEKDFTFFLLVVDSHSKWPEVFIMKSITSSTTIEALRSLFARYGFARGASERQWSAADFNRVSHISPKNGIKHTLIPAYHPASHGAAERLVQSMKQMLLKNVLDTKKPERALQHKLADWWFHYRNTPQSTTNRSPAELFLKRNPRMQFRMLKPNLQADVQDKQNAQKHHHDTGRVKQSEFHQGQKVAVRNHRKGKEKWSPGVIVAVKGPARYLTRVYGRTRYVHSDHIITRSTSDVESEPRDHDSDQQDFLPQPPIPPAVPDTRATVRSEVADTAPPVVTPELNKSPTKPATPVKPSETPKSVVEPVRRYPERQRKPVVRLNL